MIIGHPPGFNRRIGVSQGYLGLPVRDVRLHDVAVDREVPAMQTLWHPTADDLAVLASGGGLMLTILGSAHPPVMIEAVPRETFDPIPDRSTPDDSREGRGQIRRDGGEE